MLSTVSARLVLVLALAAPLSSSPIAGVVVDQNGRPLPRARVQIVTGGHTTVVFTNADGTFELAAESSSPG